MTNHFPRPVLRYLGTAALLAATFPCVGPSCVAKIAEPATTSEPVALPAEGAKLTFRRVFKSSSPEFIEIVVPEDARPAMYDIRQLDEDPGAAPFEVSAGLAGSYVRPGGAAKPFQGRTWTYTEDRESG